MTFFLPPLLSCPVLRPLFTSSLAGLWSAQPLAWDLRDEYHVSSLVVYAAVRLLLGLVDSGI